MAYCRTYRGHSAIFILFRSVAGRQTWRAQTVVCRCVSVADPCSESAPSLAIGEVDVLVPVPITDSEWVCNRAWFACEVTVLTRKEVPSCDHPQPDTQGHVLINLFRHVDLAETRPLVARRVPVA
jgi:hypothetical protein